MIFVIIFQPPRPLTIGIIISENDDKCGPPLGTKLMKKSTRIHEKMQLDIGVSPPANIITFKPGLTHLTFDLDPLDLWPRPMNLNMNYFLTAMISFSMNYSLAILVKSVLVKWQTESGAYEPTVHEHRWAKKTKVVSNTRFYRVLRAHWSF